MGCCPGGRPRTLTFHLTGATGGGSAAVEVRTGPRMERPFLISSISWVPAAATTAGQFVDLLVSSDDDTTDTATPTGQSIFQGPQNVSALPAGDADVGLPVGDQPFDIPHAFQVNETGRTIKVVARFQAPAAAPPSGSIVLVVKEFDASPMPIDPRPPIVDPPPSLPPPPPGGGGPISPAPPAPLPPSLPPPSPRVPTSYPDLVGMSLRNCVPYDHPSYAVTGAGPTVCRQPPPPGIRPPAPVLTGLPSGFGTSVALLAQRYTARVGL
jgi:hypothetical protein